MSKVRGFKRRLEPFGATQKRGREYAATRKLKNRIADLERELAAEQRTSANLIAAVNDAKRAADNAQPSENRLNSLRRICHIPLTKLVDLGLATPALIIAEWVIELEKARQ